MGLLSGWPSPRLRGDVRISQVPGGPSCTRPALRPRWSPGAASFSRAGMLPSAIPTASASTTNQISGLDHAAHALAVYASRRGSLPPVQDSLPAGRTALAGRGFPARSLEMFLVITSSSSRFSLAQEKFGLELRDNARDAPQRGLRRRRRGNSPSWAGLKWGYGKIAEDGLEFGLGKLKVRALTTPGHTDERMSYAVADTRAASAAALVFSGDALLVSDIGRTDLYGPEETERLARTLYRSIHDKLFSLGDGVILCASRGGDSVCGGKILDRDLSTLGFERDTRMPHAFAPPRSTGYRRAAGADRATPRTSRPDERPTSARAGARALQRVWARRSRARPEAPRSLDASYPPPAAQHRPRRRHRRHHHNSSAPSGRPGHRARALDWQRDYSYTSASGSVASSS